jgi:hypothetical protein
MPKKMRNYAKYTWQNIVLTTPVDTYTASNSWLVTAGQPSSFVPQYKYYGSRPAMPATLRSGSKFKTAFSGVGTSIIYIVNNQPYIGSLNNPPGNSSQAPGGRFVNKVVAKMVNIANGGGF